MAVGAASLLAAASVWLCTSIDLHAATAQPPSAASAPAGPPLPPGWAATFRAGAARGAPPTTVYSPTAAFALKPGETVFPGIPAAGFEVSYDGELRLPEAGRYRFGAEFEGGKLVVTIFGKGMAVVGSLTQDRSNRPKPEASPALTDWIKLPADTVLVRLTFSRAGDAPARLRPVWEMERAGTQGFILEPILPPLASVPANAAPACGKSLAESGGRMLIGVFGCANCHEPGDGGKAALFAFRAPDLSNAGARMYPDWIRRWMTNPQEVAPGCPMPSLLGDSEKDRADAEALTHFLVSRGGPAQVQAAATEEQTVQMGKELFHSIGCVACHGPLDKKMPAGFVPYAPYGKLAGKWRPDALSAFLFKPTTAHHQGAMPSLNLSHAEADLIATYLIKAWGPAPEPAPFTPDTAKAKAGEAVFGARGCAACHDLSIENKPIANAVKATPMARLRPGKGCLDPADNASPRYTLGEPERGAITAALGAFPQWSAAASPAPTDRTAASVEILGCTKCHEYNGAGGVPDSIKKYFVMTEEADLGDEGRIPPRLTGVGGKLNTQWLKTVLMEAGRARPYMASRMPQFAEHHLRGIAEGLACAEGVWPNSDRQEPKASQELVQAGQKLVGDQGLNCISCHIYGAATPTGTPGPAITAFAERIRYDYFPRFVLNPQRCKPGTRMTNFYTTGESAVTEVFGGNGPKQADAMWAYFTLGQFMPPPAGIQQAQGMQIRVADRPRVMRTFLKHAGSRGIAVGFPEAMGGVHFAFDAENSRLVEAWKGDFLDAAGPWAGRGGNIAGGQGSIVWSAPAGPAFVVGDKPESWPITSGRDAGMKFRGYSLDERGVPTFSYDVPDGAGSFVNVRERIEPVKGAGDGSSVGVRRRFEVSGLGPRNLWLNAGTKPSRMDGAPGVNVESLKPGDGKATWYGIRAADDAVAAKPIWFVLEVTP